MSIILPYKIENRTLILGAGGGNDIYSCLPWYYGLTDIEKDMCILASYSFTDDLYKYASTNGESEWIVKINKDVVVTKKNHDYFPERDLAISVGRDVYAFRLVANPLLADELEKFVVLHSVKQIILVDGGVDAMLYGDEEVYGSPLEDSQTMMAAYRVAEKHGLACRLMCSALHVDEVSANMFLKHWSEMESRNMGNVKVTMIDDQSFGLYKKAIRDAHYVSIIQESIVAAVEGNRGKYMNERLYPDRIDDYESMPELFDDTCCLWWVDVREYVQFSPFYRWLLMIAPSIEIRAKDDRAIHDMWRCWNQKIMWFFKEGRLIQDCASLSSC